MKHIPKGLWNSEKRKKIFTAEVNKGSTKWSIKLRDWFVWTVQINNEKGTAGGNIKINFPIKSTLLISVICIFLAILFRRLGVLVSVIFLSFGIYNFRTWIIAFKSRERVLTLKLLTYRKNRKKYENRNMIEKRSDLIISQTNQN